MAPAGFQCAAKLERIYFTSCSLQTCAARCSSLPRRISSLWQLQTSQAASLRIHLSVKDRDLISVHQDAILNVPTHRAREHNFFQIAPLFNQRLERVTMRDADYILLDNRAFVENLGYVMAGRAHQLHTAFVGAMV